MSRDICPYCEDLLHRSNCDRELLKKVNVRLRGELGQARAEAAAAAKFPGAGVIMLNSLISHRNKKPRVDIQVGEIHTQMDAPAAVDVAVKLIQVSMGAYADAFVFHFLTEKLEIDTNRVLQVIQEFRDYRISLEEEFETMQAGEMTGRADPE